MAGCDILNGATSSFTEACPARSRARIARRVGSARAENAASSVGMTSIMIRLYNFIVIVKPLSQRACREGWEDPCPDARMSPKRRRSLFRRLPSLAWHDPMVQAPSAFGGGAETAPGDHSRL